MDTNRDLEQEEQYFQTQTWLALLSEYGYLPQVHNALRRTPGREELTVDSAPLPTTAEPTDHRGLLGEREVQNVLVMHYWNQLNLIASYERFGEALSRLLGMIEAQLAR